MCTDLKLTRSSLYKWRATQARRVARTCADGLLGARIAAVFDEENGLYGAKRITASLNEAKELARVNHKKVARIMKNMNLRGFTKRRRCMTTKHSTANPVPRTWCSAGFMLTLRTRFRSVLLPICPVRTVQLCIWLRSLTCTRVSYPVSRLLIICAQAL